MGKLKSKRDVFYDWVDATNMHNTDEILYLLSEDIEIDSILFGNWKGKSNVKVLLCNVFSAFPNLFINPVTVFTNDVGAIATEIDFGGTQSGNFKGNPGFGHKFRIRGVFVFDFKEPDKINDIRAYYDSRSINRQLKIIKY